MDADTTIIKTALTVAKDSPLNIFAYDTSHDKHVQHLHKKCRKGT